MSRHRQQGFMLLEVVFAAGIVAFALVALIESLTQCIAAARTIQSYSIAQTLLANKSYEFQVEQPLDYADLNGRFEDYPGYEWERLFEGTDTEGLWRQIITVTWQSRGKPVSESIVEYRYLPDKQR
ncbi:MAG: hypothetical protein PCFJNLEI_02711 [Verrucomicrobiae bacterium]|nr:hypothetical protein [Verrucomicrobiae bacterium]